MAEGTQGTRCEVTGPAPSMAQGGKTSSQGAGCGRSEGQPKKLEVDHSGRGWSQTSRDLVHPAQERYQVLVVCDFSVNESTPKMHPIKRDQRERES